MSESTPLYFPTLVPNSIVPGSKILFVGEAPGDTEVQEKQPFVGQSGQILINCMNRHGLMRSDVTLANLCPYRPFGNKFELLLNTQVFKESLINLYSLIEELRPNVIAALGGWPLQFLTGRKGITKWRGSILPYINDGNIKVIPTVHPAAVLRDRVWYPTFDIDIKRIADDAKTPEFNLPIRRFIIDPRGLECEEWVQRLSDSEFLGTDIETRKNSTQILCCGFAPSPDLAVCFVSSSPDGRGAIERVLRSDAKKIFQFGTFDTTQLRLNNYEILDPAAQAIGRPYFWDTLNAQHVLAPELPRSLEYLTSVYTREPYYKTVGRAGIPADEKSWGDKVDKQSLYEYNCRDCCTTIEIALKQMEELNQESDTVRAIFDFSMKQIKVACHIGDAGLPVDEDRRAIIERALLEKWAKKQFILDRMIGKKCNVRSPALKSILYKDLGLPPRYKDKALTVDEDAIVSLITLCKDKVNTLVRKDAIMDWQIKLAVCQTILEIRGIRVVLSSYIRTHQTNKRPRARDDGRIHSIYRTSGTKTGRWSASKYVDGTGFNAQTLPRDPWDISAELLTKRAEDVILSQAEVNQIAEAVLLAQLEDEPDSSEETEDEDETA